MKTICAWCGKTIKEGDDKNLSHGICYKCKEKEIKKLKKSRA